MADTNNLGEIAELLKVLGHPLRLKIVNLIAGHEYAVSEIEEKTGISQPSLSQQLAIIRKSGLVRTRREAKQVFYSLDFATVAQVCECLGWMNRGQDTQQSVQSKKSRQRKLGSGATFAEIL